MKNNRTAQWAEALRSGHYAQIQSRLVSRTAEGTIGFCCLGVLCEISPAIRELDAYFDGAEGAPPASVIDWLYDQPDKCANAFGVSDDAPGEYALYVAMPEGLKQPDGADLHDKQVELSHLNDTDGLNFDQIGDLVAYFGVRLLGRVGWSE